jgi:DNA anti-recombination protein RmuC
MRPSRTSIFQTITSISFALSIYNVCNTIKSKQLRSLLDIEKAKNEDLQKKLDLTKDSKIKDLEVTKESNNELIEKIKNLINDSSGSNNKFNSDFKFNDFKDFRKNFNLTFMFRILLHKDD